MNGSLVIDEILSRNIYVDAQFGCKDTKGTALQKPNGALRCKRINW